MKAVFLIWLAALAFVLQSTVAQAMTVEVQGNQVFATGPVEDDLRKFEEAFAKLGVDTVVFVNSPGGDLWTGLRVGRLIAAKGYKTVIAGSCMSACSVMFLGGKERQFSDAFRPNQTFIGIHGAHNKDTKSIDPMVQPQIFAFYKLHMGDKFNSEVMNRALYDMEDAGSLLRVFDTVRNSITAPYHCISSQTPRDKCTKIDGQNALSLGIITEPDLLKLNLPASMQTAKTIFNKLIGEDIEDLTVALTEIGHKICNASACATPLARFPERKENRALATVIHGEGWGMSGDLDTPNDAALRALYHCNHQANSRPIRLCQVSIVNSFDMRAMNTSARQTHEDNLAKLLMPSEKYYANEEYGGGFSAASGYRYDKYTDMTPQKIEGIQTLNTQDLVKLLMQSAAHRPVLLDVHGSYETIPSAFAFLHAGFAFENPVREANYDKRFAALLKLLAPNPQAQVVFFCNARSCWNAVNAALRAKKHGYAQVGWYRGGIESWRGAQLPTAPAIYQAIAN